MSFGPPESLRCAEPPALLWPHDTGRHNIRYNVLASANPAEKTRKFDFELVKRPLCHSVQDRQVLRSAVRPAREEGSTKVPAEKTRSLTLSWSNDRLAIVSVLGHMNLGESSGDEVEQVVRDGAFRILGVGVRSRGGPRGA